MYSEPHDYPCPARGVGLTHVWDYPVANCRECKMPLVVPDERAVAGPDPDQTNPSPQPSNWLYLRLLQLGLRSADDYDPVADAIAEDPAPATVDGALPEARDIDRLIEGKHVDGLGPLGHREGKGRAGLYGQHKARMERLRAGWLRGYYD